MITSGKLKQIFTFKKLRKFGDNWQHFWTGLPSHYRCHCINVSILLIAYFLSSLLIYPKFEIGQSLKELFSLLCIYGAIYCWFGEKFSSGNTMEICLAVTACVSPVIFINNPFGVSIVALLIVVFAEYLILSYLRGCYLFNNKIPAYIICETENDIDYVSQFSNSYKILKLILLSDTERESIKISSIKTVEGMENYLRKVGYIPFCPTPRKLIYCAQNSDINNLKRLQDIAVKYSIPLFKVNTVDGDHCICPVCLSDFEIPSVPDKNSLNTLFRNKNIWICYDGRKIVSDFIGLLMNISTATLTVICDSEGLAPELQRELSKRGSNFKIKIADLSLLFLTEKRPEILFCNMPMKSKYSREDHLKESLVKNVIDTAGLIKLAQKYRVPVTFVLSNTNSVDANNWGGATQRLGELLFQHADFHHRKTLSKFKVIRIPENAADFNGFLGDVIHSITTSGCVYINSPESDLNGLYSPEEILPLMVKAVALAYKTESSAEVLTIIPKEKFALENLIRKVCNMFYLRYDQDLKVIHNHKNEEMDLDKFPNISETLEKTSVANVFTTKFVASAVGNYGNLWTLEDVGKMTSREVISAVFQSLSEKLSAKQKI